jgi:hypothetical protein
MAVVAFGAPVLATRPVAADGSQIAVEVGENSGPQLVPPAPEDSLVAIQVEDAAAPPAPGYFDAAAHGIEIIPGPSAAAEVNGRTYDDVYRSIPFNHTEYLANPSYRHEATMEILFGQLRPTTIVKEYEPQVIQNEVPSPYQPYRWSHPERLQYRAPAFRLLDPGCYW